MSEMGENCDLNEVRKKAAAISKEKIKTLRDAGIPITSKVLSGVNRKAYEEASESCKEVTEISKVQMDILGEVCGDYCQDTFEVKKRR